MPEYRITFLSGQTELVTGDDTGVEGSGAVVVYRDVLVIGRPRRIVAKRYAASLGVSAAEMAPTVVDTPPA